MSDINASVVARFEQIVRDNERLRAEVLARDNELEVLRLGIGHTSVLIRMGKLIAAMRDARVPVQEGLDDLYVQVTEWERANR